MAVDADHQESRRSLRRRGVVIPAVFGMLRAMVGASGMTGGGVSAAAIRLLAVVFAAGLITLGSARDRRRRYGRGDWGPTGTAG